MAKFQCGDVFTFQLPNKKYMFGRILLDVYKQCVKPKLIAPTSRLIFFGKSLLVEIYKEMAEEPIFLFESKVLIHGVFTSSIALDKNDWRIVDHVNVVPTQVAFPEVIGRFERKARFENGEIILPIPLTESEANQLNVLPSVQSPYVLPDICLYYLNMRELINPEYVATSHLASYDLRFNDKREWVYNKLDGMAMNESYYERALKLGYDLARFYK